MAGLEEIIPDRGEGAKIAVRVKVVLVVEAGVMWRAVIVAENRPDCSEGAEDAMGYRVDRDEELNPERCNREKERLARMVSETSEGCWHVI